MKKYLFIVALFCLGASANAQSITFYDLTNLTNLSEGQARTYLVLGRVFKHQYIEEKNGMQIEHFRTISPSVAEQTVTIGESKTLGNGAVLRSVTYTTRSPKHMLNLIAQTRGSHLILKFQGADADNNIYVFDNDFYHVKMYISTTENKGSVVIEQKEYVPY
ncbi:hypothetical protein [Mucilaginibacter pedocola]|uniref:DUF4251 domain-containing protein n=1 Tax=Mucilaginibacter pedocola TaxID=1792845 RepID=A0A1S9PI22_9SPHI|nr:hypothetical protein [Mucilaginibacter pedocola]OOQ60198.1 hypothetical protein BC343_25925 [Mucilaginibacter pedocola]